MIERLLHAVDPARYRRRRFQKLVAKGRVFMGDHSYGVPEIHVYDGDDNTRVVIGRYCSIAAGVNILLGGNHPTDRVTTFPIRSKFSLPSAGSDGYPSSKGDIRIGNDVWIGFGSTIVSGVVIGDGAVVAAGSLVVGDVPAYSIVGGNPAKVIRMRFDSAVVNQLLRLRWWDWDSDKVVERVAELCSEDAEQALVRLISAESKGFTS